MPDRAKVTSLEAIEAFRARLIIYRDRAGRLLDEVNDDVIRSRLWLQGDRTAHWQNELKRRDLDLKHKQEELFSAQMSGLREAPFAQQAAVRKAKESIHAAEEKMKVVRQWNRQFDHRVEPLSRHVEKFRHNLSHDLGEAIGWLGELIKAISAYAELSQGGENTAPPKTAEENPPAA